eukprot:1161179-Pelagomonas_calceolata.AAC.11
MPKQAREGWDKNVPHALTCAQWQQLLKYSEQDASCKEHKKGTQVPIAWSTSALASGKGSGV